MDGGMTRGHPYKYPSKPRTRRHAPRGYTNYQHQRPWLDDEFHFRCVYCLKRMQWAPTDTWSVDHLRPQALESQDGHRYENLVLACQWCNNRKYKSTSVPDPLLKPYGQSLYINERTGEAEALSDIGTILIRELQLNHPSQIRARCRYIRTLEILRREDFDEWKKWMSFPIDLPNLGAKLPPGGNDRPEGILESCYERRRRGELPDWYEE